MRSMRSSTLANTLLAVTIAAGPCSARKLVRECFNGRTHFSSVLFFPTRFARCADLFAGVDAKYIEPRLLKLFRSVPSFASDIDHK